MSDRVAFFVAILIAGVVSYDVFALDAQNIIFLAKKGMGAIEWLAFWR